MKAIYLIKRYAAFITWGVILAAIYFWVIGASQSFKNCIQGSSAYQNHNKLDEFFSIFHCNIIFVSTHDTLIGALSALGLVIVTGFLVWSGFSQVSTAKKELRAYIGVDETGKPESRHIELNGMGMRYTLASMENLGKTPALRVQYAFGLQVLPIDLPEEIFKSAKWSQKQIIQPGQKVIAQINDSETSESETLTGIRNRTIKTNVYIFGIVRYEDIFGAPHYTQFCFRIDYRNGPNHPPGWDWYKDYNKTDDQKEYLSEISMRLLRTPFMWGVIYGAVLPPSK